MRVHEVFPVADLNLSHLTMWNRVIGGVCLGVLELGKIKPKHSLISNWIDI